MGDSTFWAILHSGMGDFTFWGDSGLGNFGVCDFGVDAFRVGDFALPTIFQNLDIALDGTKLSTC